MTITKLQSFNLNSNGNYTFQSANVTGNVTANYFIGNGSQLSGIDATTIQNGTANVRTFSSSNVTVSASGNANILVITGTGANIEGTLNVTGNANVGNIGIGSGSGGNLSGANNISANTFTGALTTASQPNITSLGTLTSLSVNGTVTAVAFTANTGVFTGNGNGLSSLQASNITGVVSSATSATNASALLQNTSTSTTVYPTFTTSSSNGNSQAVFNTSISANLGNASITATTFVGALSGAATTATTAGTVTTAAQPNITSVGTLTGLTVTGTITTQAAATQDAVKLAGRAGGTSSYAVTLTPTTLSANRTLTLPDADTTVVGNNTTQTLTNKTLQAYNEVVTTIGTINTSTYTLDLSQSNLFDLTLGTNVTITFSNAPSAGISRPTTLVVRQPAASPGKTLTVTGAKYTDGVTPVLSNGASQIDVLTYWSIDGGTTYFGTFAMANVS